MELNTTINQLPVNTWNWLKMNRAVLQGTAPDAGGSNVLPEISELSAGVTLNSSAQAAAGLDSAAGKDFTALMDSLHAPVCELTAAEGVQVQTPVIMRWHMNGGSASYTRQIIRAEAGAQLTVIMVYDSAEGKETADGFHGIQTWLYAGKGAQIHLAKVQLLGSKFLHIDDTSSICAEDALVNVTQLELGADSSYVAVNAALPELRSRFQSDTGYLCCGTQKLDMNYVAVHTGKKTDCKMQVKGTVRDTAAKTYRGTIDFRNGCSGSTGDEQEETLLLSPGVVNKSIPLILCGEEDVAGEHGASIGQLGEDLLFYMNSRGISRRQAELLAARAKIQSVASLIPDGPDGQLQEQIRSFVDSAFSAPVDGTAGADNE